jgi:hypothetical protein
LLSLQKLAQCLDVRLDTLSVVPVGDVECQAAFEAGQGLTELVAFHLLDGVDTRRVREIARALALVLLGLDLLEALVLDLEQAPPPDVPELEENHGAIAAKSLRERLEMHRRDAVCASCHDRIDPLGFGLENYDVLGRWRTSDKGMAIDARGALPNGATFDGPQQLKSVLLERKELFIRNLVSKMLGYALGRGLTLTDQCTVDQIAGKLKDSDYNAHTLILEIVNSVPFRFQPGTDPESRVILTEAP